jgi:outer membrane receptor protein involved in Fe transport
MLHRKSRRPISLNLRPLVALTSAILASAAAARAEESPAAAGGLDEVIVTAQKRSENLQSVPISIQAFDARKLEELQVASFDDYSKYLPSLSVQSYGPGQAQLYVRGVTNGGDGLKVGSQPLVGVYLDEMPVTTIGNNLDIHVYDIERVEALSGPQGTLFGSSSMAGTMRIITNKPNPAKTEGGFDVTLNTISKGAPGGKVEGFVNLPIGERAAVRLVAWHQEDGGYINNVPNPAETYPTSGVPRSNAGLVKKNYNWVDTTGGRAALKINLNDTWSVTPTVQTQHQVANGQFGYTPFGVNSDSLVIPPSGDLNVSRFYPERNDDTWTQATLTVQGKIGNLDAIYAGGYLKRKIDSVADYSDYSFFYDVAYAASASYFGNNFQDVNGNVIDPSQTTISHNSFSKVSHELRLSTPQDWRLRGVLGVFLQHQTNDTRDEYRVANLAPSLSITGEPGVLYLNSQSRVDRDSAVFTDLSFDILPKLTLTGGLRLFRYDNSVYGFFGYNGNPPGGTPDGLPRKSGEVQCASVDPTNPVRPCANINSDTKRSGTTYRVNLTYKFDDDRMVYSTWSTGFRPGGVNRVTTRPPYNPDYLTNIEAGWKTTWFEHRLRFNGAVFLERWKDAQFAISGLNGITEITNASRSEIRGVEAEVHWKASAGLTLSASATFLDAKLTDYACNYATTSPTCSDEGNSPLAPSGTRLPVSSKFKGNVIGRYEWTAGEYDAHVQLAGVFQSNAIAVLTVTDAQKTGTQPGYASFDLSGGAKHGAWSYEVFVENLTDKRGEVTRYNSCAPSVCTLVNVIPIRPRMVGVTIGRSF